MINTYTKLILKAITVWTRFIALKDTKTVPSAKVSSEQINKIAIKLAIGIRS